jgi:hypothetical protein
MTGILHDELQAFRRTCPAAGLHITVNEERQKFFSEFRRHLNVYKKNKKRCKITLQTQLYLCEDQLRVSAINSHHQTEHRTINNKNYNTM